MGTIRRLAAAGGLCALTGAYIGGSPATAQVQQAEVFVGSAAAKALDLNILGQQATFGAASSKITSQLTARAEGAGQLVPALTNFAGNQTAEVTGRGTDTKARKCVSPSLGSLESLLNIGLVCSSASASVTNGNPVATSEGSIAEVTLDAQTALAPLGAVTTPIQGTLAGTLGSVCSALNATCPATTTVSDLVNSVLKTRTLDVAVGKAVSSVVTEAGKITSTATANGSTIKILPLPTVNGLPSLEPVATIIVGDAKATSVLERATGRSTPSFDPALVRVRVNTVATGVQEIAVAPGQDITILQGTPLESRIAVAAGRNVTNADGTVGAVADGVRLELLKGLNGGVTLGLAHAEAGVAGSPARLELARELPRTGGAPLVPLAGAGVVALAVLVRRSLARAVR